MPEYQSQFWNAASTNNINVTWPGTTSGGGLTIYPYMPLQPIADPSNERSVMELRDLTPVEWLRKQVDDVCFLARAA